MKILLALIAVSAFAQGPPGASAPFVKQFYTTNGGQPAAGYKLCTYVTGTSTPLLTYSNATLGTPNANPIVLDAAGRPPTAIFLQPLTYRFSLLLPTSATQNCTTGTMSAVWTYDPVADIGQLVRAGLASVTGANLIGFEPTGGDVATNVGAALNSAFLYDIGYSTLPIACAAAVSASKTLMLTRAWSVGALTCAANVQALKGGSITYTGALVFSGSFAGDTTQHFIPSGGSASLSFTGSVDAILPEWFDAAGSTDSAAAINLAISAAVTGQTVSLGSYTIGTPVIVPGTSQGVKIVSRFFQRWSASNGGNPSPKFNLTAKTGASPFALLKIYSATVHYEDITVNCNNGIGVNGFLIVTGLSSVFNNILAENCSGDGIRLDPAGGGTTTTSTGILTGAVNPTIVVGTTTLEGQIIGSSTPGNTIILLDWGTNKQEVFVVGAVVGTSVTLTGTAQYTHTGTYTVRLTGNTNLMQFYNPRSYGSGYVFGSGGTRTCTAGTGILGTAAGVGWGMNQYNSATNDGNGNVWVNFYTSANACGGLIITEFGNTVLGGGSEGDHGPGLQIGDSAGRDATPHNGRIGIRNIVNPLGEVEGIGAHTRGINIACGVQNSIQVRSSAEIFNYNACSPLYDVAYGAAANNAGTGEFGVINYNSTIYIDPNFGTSNGGAMEFWSAPRDQDVIISSCTNANPMVCTVPLYYTPADSAALFTLSGFTGAWTSANGIFTTARVTATSFSIPIDSSGFGAVTGSPLLNGARTGYVGMNNGAMGSTLKSAATPFTMNDGTGKGFIFKRNGTSNIIEGLSTGPTCFAATGNATSCGGSFSLTEYDSGGASLNVGVDPGINRVAFPGGIANKAACFKADGATLGRCASAVDAAGGCTCN